MKHERMGPSFITTPKGEKLVVITAAEYEYLVASADEQADMRAYDRAKSAIAAGQEEMLPGGMVQRLFKGENPVRVWREHRDMSAKDLAQAAGLSGAYVSQIESGKRDGTVGAYRKMAKALRVTLDDLTWEAPPKRKKRKVAVKGR